MNMGPWEVRNVSATYICPPFSIRGHLKKKDLECGHIYKLVKYESSNASIQISVANPKITSRLPAERDDSAATFATASFAPSTRSHLLFPERKTTLLQHKRRLGKADNTPNHHFSHSLKGWARFDKQTAETLRQQSKGEFIP